jgi:hypothetical protein
LFRFAPRFAARLALAAVFIALAVLPAAALDRNAFSFTRYDLRLSFDPHQHGLSVEGTIELRNAAKEPQRQAVLQISSSLQWLALHAADGAELEWLAQTYTSDIDHTGTLSEAIVKLPKAVAPGETVVLEVRYSGTVFQDTTRLERAGTPAAVALRSDWDQISDAFTALRGAGFVVWYPVSMNSADLSQGNELFETLRDWREREASSVLRVRLSRVAGHEGENSKFSFITNGSVANEAAPNASAANHSGEEITVEFRGEDSVGDPVIVLLTDPAASIDHPNVSAHFTTAHTEYARDYAVAAEAVIAPLEQWFGAPRRKVVLVELTDPDALPYDAGSFYFVPMRNVPHAAAEVALARPVVHAMLESPRPWIREGAAAFGQALIRERQAGRHDALLYLGQFSSALAVAEAQSHSTLAAGESSSSEPPSIGLQPLITTADEIFFRTKAAYVWWMLRDMVGDRVLQSALTRYRAADDRDSGYMQRLLEERTSPKRELEQFFDDWVYRDRGLPQLRAVSANARRTLGETTVTAVTVENNGDAGCEVPVMVRSADKENMERLVVSAKSKATVRVTFEADPKEAVVNDGSVPEAERGEHVIPVSF